MRHLQDQTVLILGLGASGLAMARWCVRHGAQVTVADTREAPALLATLRQELPGVMFVSGAFSPELVQGTGVRAVYRSPGLTPATVAPVVEAARAIGLPVGGELDLFARALTDLREPPPSAGGPEETPEPADPTPSPDAAETMEASDALASSGLPEEDAGLPADAFDELEEMPAPGAVESMGVAVDAVEDAPLPVLPALALPEKTPGYGPAVLAITGTNGKTTVTSLVGQLVQRSGKTVAVAGNIGPTLLDTLSAHMDADTLPQVWVLELSSFQLADVQDFEPTAAVVL
ncbi:MAG: Mur ligase family protein, partial [Polaromonas sp.]